jgi:hypothetical protein
VSVESNLASNEVGQLEVDAAANTLLNESTAVDIPILRPTHGDHIEEFQVNDNELPFLYGIRTSEHLASSTSTYQRSSQSLGQYNGNA